MARRHGHLWASYGTGFAWVLVYRLAFICWWLLVKSFLVILLPHAAATDWLSDRAIRKRLLGAVWLDSHRTLVASLWAVVSAALCCTHARYHAGLCVCLHALRPRVSGSVDMFCRLFEETPSVVLIEHVGLSVIHACAGATVLLGRLILTASSYTWLVGVGVVMVWKLR
jgi:hypothetical protein